MNPNFNSRNLGKAALLMLLVWQTAVQTQAQIIMGNGNVQVCNVQFLDPGGVGSYTGTGGYLTQTFSPLLDGDKVSVNFSSFSLGNRGSDELSIYDGPTTSSPLLYQITRDYYRDKNFNTYTTVLPIYHLLYLLQELEEN